MTEPKQTTGVLDQEIFGIDGAPEQPVSRTDRLNALHNEHSFTVGTDPNADGQYDTTTDVAMDMWWKTYTHQHRQRPEARNG